MVSGYAIFAIAGITKLMETFMTPQPATLADQVYQQLREQIIRGVLSPGTRLVQRQLAKQLGTSSIPVLEAIRRLERDGLVSSHPRWGAQVECWTKEDIEGAYLMREALEGVAGRLFAERATPMERMALEECHTQFIQTVRMHDEYAIGDADVALHQHIFHCTRSRIFYRLAENSCVITTTIYNASRLLAVGQRTLPDEETHCDLVAALLSGDPDRAERAAKEHVRMSMQRLLISIA